MGGLGGLPKIKYSLLIKSYFKRILSLAQLRYPEGFGGAKIVIYSFNERKSAFYSLHLHLLMRPLVLLYK
jgi:hypothetical protein